MIVAYYYASTDRLDGSMSPVFGNVMRVPAWYAYGPSGAFLRSVWIVPGTMSAD